MARNPSPQEKQTLKGWFPQLNVNAVVVTGETSTVYNCISWTVGVTSAWYWPGSSIQAFDAFYARFGLRRMGSGHVAAWGTNTSNMLHGSVTAPPPLMGWESKCGSYLRITHGMHELTSSTYGRILAFYGRSRLLPSVAGEIESLNAGQLTVALTSAEQERLGTITGRIPEELRTSFEERFEAWRKSWSQPHLLLQSDPSAFRHSAEFADLIALGPETLSLVVEKLVDPENFLALQLYDSLQPSADLVIATDPDSDEAIEGEQGRALRAVQRFLSSL